MFVVQSDYDAKLAALLLQVMEVLRVLPRPSSQQIEVSDCLVEFDDGMIRRRYEALTLPQRYIIEPMWTQVEDLLDQYVTLHRKATALHLSAGRFLMEQYAQQDATQLSNQGTVERSGLGEVLYLPGLKNKH